MTRAKLVLVVLAATTIAQPVSAQTLGTFRWQMQPYCNLLTLTVTQIGGVYRVEGTDDECGAGRDRASVAGLAFPNPDGSIGMGMTIVTPAKGTAVHLTVEIALPTLSGTWRMASGDSGPFVFSPGSATPGYPRPLPAAGATPPEISLLPGGSIVARVEGDGGIPANGPGTRMMWYAHKAAFRAGTAGSSEWDEANVGQSSTATGASTIASGRFSVAMGYATKATATYSVALGSETTAINNYSLATGSATTASGVASTAMGAQSVASGDSSVAMGWLTTASGRASTAIGEGTVASGGRSLAGGQNSSAIGDTSLAFGLEAAASGVGSVVLGRTARTSAAGSGSFMFADRSSSAPFQSNAPNEFGARFAGGFYLYTRADLGTGAALAANGSSWASLSDVNAKENFRDVSGEEVLRKLARIPIREWNYKAQDRSIRHMGPTAQDFNAAFGLGDFPLRINTIDADGIALAAINALESRTRDLPRHAAELERLDADNAALRELLDATRAELAKVHRQVGDLTQQILRRK
jgi:trimeric autotransporter adhesin